MYKIEFDMPNLARGTEVQIDGLGTFANGGTYTITNEQAAAFRVAGRKQRFVPDGHGAVDVVTEDGPTVLQAFKDAEGVTVTTTSSPSGKKADTGPQQPELPEADEKEDN